MASKPKWKRCKNIVDWFCDECRMCADPECKNCGSEPRPKWMKHLVRIRHCAIGAGPGTTGGMRGRMDHQAPEPGRLVRLTSAYTDAVNTSKEHICGIIVTDELAYGQYIQALVGESIWLLDERDYEVLDEAG